MDRVSSRTSHDDDMVLGFPKEVEIISNLSINKKDKWLNHRGNRNSNKQDAGFDLFAK